MQKIKVFCAPDGKFGEPTEIVIDEKHEISTEHRQEMAKASGFDEIVFIDDVAAGKISIYNPIRKWHLRDRSWSVPRGFGAMSWESHLNKLFVAILQ